MTQSERIYMEARERLLNNHTAIVTDEFIMEVIQDLYGDLDFMGQQALLDSINIPSLVEDVKEQLAEEESYDRDPLAHVGMSPRDFI
ncbi:MAG: hypothetical protein ACI33P_00335 [Lysinibacillus sp.]